VLENDTIVAIATGVGGGVGIVRISGCSALNIAEKITDKKPSPRIATFCAFRNDKGSVVDSGIILFFPAPHSFTGEDVVELQGHGGAVVLDQLQNMVIALGARQARPGEFSERAFLNNKIDLAQAEAIADIITASNSFAARSAVHSLQGVFSEKINQLIAALVALRVYIEASMDFPEEEVDFLTAGKIKERLSDLGQQLNSTIIDAQEGALMTEGLTIVIAGKPNVGKSSLLNALSQRDSAIVTSIAGTTRDVLREHIQIDGMPVHIIDTAGLRESNDPVEQEGIRRAKIEIENADQILLVTDSNETALLDVWPTDIVPVPQQTPILLIRNKSDLINQESSISDSKITLSAKTGDGILLLKQHLKKLAGYTGEDAGKFSARRRHITALKNARRHTDAGFTLLLENNAVELLAEELRLAQQELEAITGRFAPDDLLEKIFRSFCIGK